MSSLYQSPLRREINEKIYKKPIFEVSILGTPYRGITKPHRMLGKEFRRSLIHGIELPNHTEYDNAFHELLRQLQHDHRQAHDLFLQVGITTPLLSYPTHTASTTVYEERIEHLQRDLLTRYDLRPTVREHMPQATIILPIESTVEAQVKACSESGKRMYNKGKKAGLTFVPATEVDWKPFRQIRYTTSYDKGFSILPEEQFLALMRYLTETKNGWLFLAKKDDQIVSGSVCLYVDKTLIYLYGATDRAYGSIGAHYRLTLQITRRAHEKKIHSFDLLGVAPPGAPADHYLAGVSRFKQSFGGETIVSLGSYDLICNSWGYKAFAVWRKIRS